MATVNVMDCAPPTPLTVATNTWGNVTFENLEYAGMFARDTATRLASLLNVLSARHQEIDGGFMTDVLELANDMAYQLQGVTELLSPPRP